MLNFFKKTISNLLNYFNLTVIKSDFLTKIDIDRKFKIYLLLFINSTIGKIAIIKKLQANIIF